MNTLRMVLMLHLLLNRSFLSLTPKRAGLYRNTGYLKHQSLMTNAAARFMMILVSFGWLEEEFNGWYGKARRISRDKYFACNLLSSDICRMGYAFQYLLDSFAHTSFIGKAWWLRNLHRGFDFGMHLLLWCHCCCLHPLCPMLATGILAITLPIVGLCFGRVGEAAANSVQPTMQPVASPTYLMFWWCCWISLITWKCCFLILL